MLTTKMRVSQWWRVLTQTPHLNLNQKMGEQTVIQNCAVEFRKRCPFTWDGLTTTEREGERHCSTCERAVFFCSTNDEAIHHAREGDCIAMTMLDREGLPVVYLGEPEEPPSPPTPEQLKLEAQYRFEQQRMEAIRNEKYTDQYCPECGFPQPKWHDECRVCAAKK